MDLLDNVKWNNVTTYPKHIVAHRRKTTGGLDNDVAEAAGIDGPYKYVFLASLEAGGFIIPHIDSGPHYERWHVPIVAAGIYWEDGEYFEPEDGVPFRVNHELPHAVYNATPFERIHLIVDRNIMWHGSQASPLILTDMIPEIQLMIDGLEETETSSDERAVNARQYERSQQIHR